MDYSYKSSSGNSTSSLKKEGNGTDRPVVYSVTETPITTSKVKTKPRVESIIFIDSTPSSGVTSIRAVYSDLIRSLDLGKMEISRASYVEFNPDTQMWEARYPDGRLIYAGRNRADVLDQEIVTITKEIEQKLL